MIEPGPMGAEGDAQGQSAAPGTVVRGHCARHPERLAEATCARCGDNLCGACGEERVDGVCKSCVELLSSRGRVWQMPWLAVVTMVHGSLLLLWGIGLVVSGGWLGLSLGNVQAGQPDAPPPELMAGLLTGVMLFMAIGQVIPGVLQLASGYFMLRFRYRALAIAAYLSGALSITGCYCLPTATLLAIWGLFVVFDKDVAARFEASRS